MLKEWHFNQRWFSIGFSYFLKCRNGLCRSAWEDKYTIQTNTCHFLKENTTKNIQPGQYFLFTSFIDFYCSFFNLRIDKLDFFFRVVICIPVQKHFALKVDGLKVLAYEDLANNLWDDNLNRLVILQEFLSSGNNFWQNDHPW